MEVKPGLFEALDNYLKTARTRSNQVLIICVLALLSVLSGNQELPEKTSTYHAAELFDSLNLREINSLLEDGLINRWARNPFLDSLEKLQYKIWAISDIMDSAGYSGNEYDFFTFGNTMSGYFFAIESFQNDTLPNDIVNWDTWQLNNLGELLYFRDIPEFDIARILELDSIMEGYGSDELCPKYLVSEIKKLKYNIYWALYNVDSLFINHELFKDSRYRELKKDGELLTTISDLVYNAGFLTLRPVLESRDALNATRFLKLNSVSLLGFTISGLLLLIFLPTLAALFAFEFYLFLQQARKYSETFITGYSELLDYFPWFLGSLSISKSSSLRVVALLIFLCPVSFLVILIISFQGTWAIQLYSSILILILMLFQILGFKELRKLGKANTSDNKNENELTQIQKLIQRGAKGITTSWKTLHSIATIISIFFLTFLFVPDHLIEDKSEVIDAYHQRQFLEEIYVQRFTNNSEEFRKWFDTAFESLNDLVMLDMYHFGYPEVDTLMVEVSNYKPLTEYVYSVHGISDQVADFNVRINEMDIQTVENLLEVTYTSELDSLALKIREFSLVLNEYKIDPKSLDEIPDYVEYGGAVLPILYKTIVEKGGFGTDMIVLPPKESLLKIVEVSNKMGFRTVNGLDSYVKTLTEFNDTVSKQELKLFGVTISRKYVGIIAMGVITFLMMFTLIQLIMMKKRLATSPISNKEIKLILAIPSYFLFFTNHRSHNILISIGSVLWPIFVLILIQFYSPSFGGSLNEYSFCILILGLILGLMLVIQRFKFSSYVVEKAMQIKE